MSRVRSPSGARRPAEAVFDYVADQTNEPEYNPNMVRAEKDTAGPIGKGTRFRSAVQVRVRRCHPEMSAAAAGRAHPLRSGTSEVLRRLT